MKETAMTTFARTWVLLVVTLAPAITSAQTHPPLIPPPPAPIASGTGAEPVPVPPQAAPTTVPHPEFRDSTYPERIERGPLHSWASRTPVGPTTTTLLRSQAAGTQAGEGLPTLGATAEKSWRRYLDSFSSPLPPLFENTVETR